MFYVISYDIADDRRRYRVAKILEDHGIRVQESVFDCELDNRQILELREALLAEMDPDFDSVRFYALCAHCRESIELIGPGRLLDNPDIRII